MTASRGDSKPSQGCRPPRHDAVRPTERQLRANACDRPSPGRSGYGDGTQSLGVQRRPEPLSPGRIMADDNRHAMDETIQPGDVVVSHVNGTRDFYIIATVLSTAGDLTLHSISTVMGQDAAIVCGYERQKDDHAVWLFAGSAGAYVKAPPCETVDKSWRIPRRAVTKDLTLRQSVCSEAACRHLAARVIQQAVRDLSGCRFSKRRDPFLTTFSKPFPPLE